MADDLVQRAPTAVGVDERVGDRRAGRNPVVRGDRTRSRDWRGAGPACLVLVAALLSGACGGGSASPAATPVTVEAPADTPPPITSAESTGATTVPSVKEEVAVAYAAYWTAWVAANNPPDPDHPALALAADGPALVWSRDQIAQRRAIGIVMRMASVPLYRHVVTGIAVDGDEAVVADCSIDDAVLVSRDSGAVLNDAVESRRITASVVRGESGWRVRTWEVVEAWEGVDGCAR